jgi:hypothetical protein
MSSLHGCAPEWLQGSFDQVIDGKQRSIHDAEMRGRYDNVGSAIKRLQAYLEDGNKEHLADAANLCMCEHVTESCHPSPAFRGTDDGEHTRRLR